MVVPVLSCVCELAFCWKQRFCRAFQPGFVSSWNLMMSATVSKRCRQSVSLLPCETRSRCHCRPLTYCFHLRSDWTEPKTKASECHFASAEPSSPTTKKGFSLPHHPPTKKTKTKKTTPLGKHISCLFVTVSKIHLNKCWAQSCLFRVWSSLFKRSHTLLTLSLCLFKLSRNTQGSRLNLKKKKSNKRKTKTNKIDGPVWGIVGSLLHTHRSLLKHKGHM